MANPLLHNINPLGKAIMFLGFLLIMNIVGSAVGMGLAMALNDVDLPNMLGILQGQGGDGADGVMRSLAFGTQLFGFLVASWLFTLLVGKASTAPIYWKGSLWLLAVPAIYIFFTPVLEASIVFNESLIPEGSWLESVFKPMEENASKVIEQMLDTDSVMLMLVNLLIVAVLPAIGEEWAFRGILQGQLSKAFKNEHAGIWATGFLFSAFHMQFYGFLPRMMMGVVFGYLLIWSRSIWVPILMHFINNAAAVVLTYLDKRGSVDIEALSQESLSWMLLIPSTIVLGISFWFMHRKSNWADHRKDYLKFEELRY